MALFKISKGLKANLPSTYNEGYCYFTTDDGKMYIDTTSSSSGRICLNAEKADTANKLTSARTINGLNFDGSANINNYGYCETTAATAAKKVTVGGTFTLATGAFVIIKFKYANTASSPTLNVNNTGAKPIYQYGTTKVSTSSTTTGWSAGAVQLFVYDGSGWVRNFWSNTTYSKDAVQCTTAAGTAAKEGSTSYYSLDNDYFVVMLRYANTAASAITLNINSLGAKPIYINGEPSSSTNYTLPTGLYLVHYDGTNYHFRTDNRIPGTVVNADKLTTNAGSATQPIYFADGIPKATTYTLEKSVPANAKFTDTTYSNFVKSGSGAKAGLVPAPSTTAGTTKYLREDGTWQVPPDTDTKYTLPTASSSTLGGVKIGNNINISSGVISVPIADKDTAGVTIVYPAASCTTFSSDSGTITPLAAQKSAELFAITRPPKRSSNNPANPGEAGTCTTNNIVRWLNTAGDVQDSKITIEDVTNTKDTTKKAQVISIPAEGGKKMVYGYCTDQVDGTSFIGGVFDANATTYPYAQGLAIGGTSGNLLWKGKAVSTQEYVNNKVAGLVDSAPETLNTLNELAAALGDDENFATTVATNIGKKADKTIEISAGTGLTGGGTLEANRTLSLATISGLTAGTYGPSANVSGSGASITIPQFTIDAYGRVTAASSKTYTSPTIDNAMNSTSTNPVQNKVIKAYIDGKVPNMSAYLPKSAGADHKITGPLGFTEGVNYGTTLPSTGFDGQLFFLEDDSPALPTGGAAGQALIKNSAADGDASWKDIVALPKGGGTGQVLIKNSDADGDGKWSSYFAGTSNASNTLFSNNTLGLEGCLQYFQISNQNSANDLPEDSWYHVLKMNHGIGDEYYKRLLAFDFHSNKIMTTYKNGASTDHTTRWKQLWMEGDSVTGAVWNDYAEYRESDCEDFGYVLMENGDDTLSKTTERLSHFAGISSDTWGFSQGETDKAKTPIAVAGRVLAYPYQDRNNYKPGDCVCAAPGGTVDIMTREEIINWPDRIVGTVSCVPDYEEWGGGENADRPSVKVNNRIWIKVR